MQMHRTGLPPTAILSPSPAPLVGSVQGLGLTDALRVELRKCQGVDFLEALDELRGPLIEAYDNARRDWLSLSRGESGASPEAVSAAEEKLWTANYELRVIAAVRYQIAQAPIDDPIVIVGPAITVSRIIDTATRNVAGEVGEMLAAAPRLGPDVQTLLPQRAAALQAWIQTYADCRAVDCYSFDPNWDPITGTS
jgi:hypothetical protein